MHQVGLLGLFCFKQRLDIFPLDQTRPQLDLLDLITLAHELIQAYFHVLGDLIDVGLDLLFLVKHRVLRVEDLTVVCQGCLFVQKAEGVPLLPDLDRDLLARGQMLLHLQLVLELGTAALLRLQADEVTFGARGLKVCLGRGPLRSAV